MKIILQQNLENKQVNLETIDIKSFEKYYVLDTNIILNNVNNLKRLSQENKNLIV